MKETATSRRGWLRMASLAGFATAASAQDAEQSTAHVPAREPGARSVYGMKFEPRQKVRVGLVGVGGRGSSLLQNFAAVDNVEVIALCDIYKAKCEHGQAALMKAGQSTSAEIYAGNDHSFEALAKRNDLDLVIIATPWVWHVPIAVFAMKQGRHVGVEVPAARTLEDCWELVNTSEQTQRHCIQLENCCYGYNEMLVWNMVKAGKFGGLIHGGAAYLHDLRSLLISDEGEGLWRRNEHFNRNGNLYPTHGLGPVAHYMDINRGDRFQTIVSVSSLSTSLASYRDQHVAADSPKRMEHYLCGDQNTSLIRTARGRLIRLEHNVTSPQPYDRINLIAGTKGMFKDYPPVIYLDGSPKEEYVPIDAYKKEFEPPIWTRMGEIARKLGGHGGMDFIMCYRLIQCMREGAPPDIDVYDAAAWSAAGALSEISVASGSAPAEFPDFTRGLWTRG